MEIQTAPRPATATPWGRALLCAVVLGPLVVLVLLPLGLGLERYVMTGDSMAGSIPRGSLLFERVVPASDLKVGDVITYDAPRDAEISGRITHRIVSVGPDGIVTRGDAEPANDPWVLSGADPTLSRLEVHVPVVGWAYLVVCRAQGWILAVVSAFALALLSRRVGPRLARREGGEP